MIARLVVDVEMTQAEYQAGRACVLSGFLSSRLADENEPGVSRACALVGFLW